MELTNVFIDKKEEDLLEYFRATRFSYRIGKPFISDMEYDLLVDRIKVEHPTAEELFQVYEHDKINKEELERYGIDPFDIMVLQQGRHVEREFKYSESLELLATDNKSILPIKTLEDEYSQIKSLGSGTYSFSPKIDGINISSIWERVMGELFQLKCGKTRGDISSSIDVTDSLTEILPQTKTFKGVTENSLRVSFEATYNFLEVASSGYKNQRSAAQGVFASTVNKKPEFFKNIVMYCHGTSLQQPVSQSLEYIKTTGIDTVPILTACFDSEMSYEDYLEFIAPIKEFFSYWKSTERVDIDGIVVTKEDFEDDVDGTAGTKQYNKNVYAIKTEYWNNGYFESKIVGFSAEQQNSDISYAILFEPVVMPDGKTQQKITDIRLRTIRDEKMKIGDTVGFNYYNATTVKFVKKVDV